MGQNHNQVRSRLTQNKWYHYVIQFLVLLVAIANLYMISKKMLAGNSFSFYMHDIFIFGFCVSFIVYFYMDAPVLKYNESEIEVFSIRFALIQDTVCSYPLSSVRAITKISPSCIKMDALRSNSNLQDSPIIHGNEEDISRFLDWFETKTGIKAETSSHLVDPHLNLVNLFLVLVPILTIFVAIVFSVLYWV